MTRIYHRYDAGFTLVELLVVMAITGLITALLATGFRTTTDEWQQLTKRGGERDKCGALRHMLRGLLERSYPALIDDGHGQTIVDFAGEPKTLSLLGPLPAQFGAGDIVRMTLSFDPENNLHFGWQLDRPGGEDFAANHISDMVIARGLSQTGFRYFGDDDGGFAWQPTWSHRRTLPSLISISMPPCADIASGSIVVAPRITSAGCVNRVTGRCSA